MPNFSDKDFRQFLDKVLLDISHPLLVIITFLLSPIIIAGNRTFMAVHIVKGMDDFRLYAIFAVVGLLLISLSYILYWRIFTVKSSRLNMMGGICLCVAFKVAHVSDEGNWDPKNFYIGIATFAFGLSLGLFMAYYFPFRFNGSDVNE